MNKVLVTGDFGQLGQEFQVLQTQYPDWEFLFPGGRAGLDITNAAEVDQIFEHFQPNFCINCAAYTQVDKAETEPDLAKAVNADGVLHLAKACTKHSTQLIHFSTDYVYGGQQNRPFVETDATHPTGTYASTKLQGEQLLLATLPTAIVIRTSWVYSSFGHNFVKTMLRLGATRDQLSVVFDQIGTPTYARDLAKATLQIIQAKIAGESASGIFHYSNEGVCSWYDFAQAIFELSGVAITLSPIESKDYPTPAHRPHFSVLNKAKIKSTFGLTIPHWRTSLESCLETLKAGS
ncbi:MAG: dTDP-4-dehydrorhamnose reductase [Bacteroidota bacterium]